MTPPAHRATMIPGFVAIEKPEDGWDVVVLEAGTVTDTVDTDTVGVDEVECPNEEVAAKNTCGTLMALSVPQQAVVEPQHH
jgi:hypothetical protein